MRTFALSVVVLLVMACAAARADEPPAGWSGDAAAGFSLTRGNSDTKNANLALNLAQRLSPTNVVKYDAFYLRGDSNGNLTVDRTVFGARDEVAFSALTYAFADAHFLRDHFKEIDYLVTPAVGIGHHIIKRDDLDLAAEGGAGVLVEKDSGFARTTSGALQARQLLTWKFSPTATLGETAAGLWKANQPGDALYHLEASLASSLTPKTQLKLSALDDYKTRPRRAGIKKNDVSIIAAFAMKF
jgi:putative salt-induced outer membrane protein YdiY